LRKSIAERFAALTRERRELKPIGLAMKFTRVPLGTDSVIYIAVTAFFVAELGVPDSG